MTYTTQYSSPVGRLTLACDGISLTGLWLEGQKYFGSTMEERTVPQDALPIFSQAKGWLDRYFSGEISAPTSSPLPLPGPPCPCRVPLPPGGMAHSDSDSLGASRYL